MKKNKILLVIAIFISFAFIALASFGDDLSNYIMQTFIATADTGELNNTSPSIENTKNYNITIGNTRADFTLIDNTDECFIDCYMIFNITVNNSFLVPNAKNFTANFELGNKANNLQSWGYQILQTIDWNESIAEYGLKENCSLTNISYCWNETIITDYHKEPRSRQEWIDFNPTGFTFAKNQVYYIKLWGKKAPKLGDNNIDAKPVIAGKELPWQWWNSSWNSCRNITIVSSSTEALVNFTILVNVTKQANMQSNLNDLRFVNDSCDKNDSSIAILNYEIENQTTTNGMVWVKVDTIPAMAANRTIAMYYNNSLATNGENRYLTWDVNYTQVLHLNDTNTNRIDSSTKRDNGTAIGGTTTRNLTNSTGYIGWANTFDEIDDYILHNITDKTEQQGIVEAMIKVNRPAISNGEEQAVLCSSVLATTASYICMNVKGNTTNGKTAVLSMYRVTQGNCWVATTTDVGDGNWHYIVYQSNSTKFHVFVDGIRQTLTGDRAEAVTMSDNGQWFGDYVGAQTGTEWGVLKRSSNAFWLNATMDELRVSNINRSFGWINMTAKILLNNSQFVIIGNEINATAPPTITNNRANLTDNLTYSEGLIFKLVASRKLSDRLNLTDALFEYENMARYNSDNLTLIDSIKIKYGHNVYLSDNITLLDSISSKLVRVVKLYDVINLTDYINRKTAATRNEYDLLNLTDAIARKSSFKEILSDALNLTDYIARGYGRKFGFFDTLNMTDNVQSIFSYGRKLSDNLNITETIIVKKIYVKYPSDVLNLTDTLITRLIIRENLADAINLTDIIISKAGLTKKLYDTLSLIDFVNYTNTTFTGFVYNATITDIISINDRIVMTTNVFYDFEAQLKKRGSLAFLDFNWTSYGGALPIYYNLTLIKNGTVIATGYTTATSYRFAGLNGSTNFTLLINATDSMGNSRLLNLTARSEAILVSWEMGIPIALVIMAIFLSFIATKMQNWVLQSGLIIFSVFMIASTVSVMQQIAVLEEQSGVNAILSSIYSMFIWLGVLLTVFVVLDTMIKALKEAGWIGK